MEENLRIKDSITSLELLEQINIFRKQEYRDKDNFDLLTEAEKKRGHYVELQHKTLLDIIRDEFEEEITGQKILLSEYIDSTGRKLPMFILTFEQAKQLLMRESKFVRKAIMKYIDKLENRVKELESKPREMTPEEMLSRSLLYAHNLIQEKDRLLEQKDVELKEKDKIIVDKNTQIIFKDMKLRSQEHKVETYDTISEKNKTYSMNEVAKMIDYVNMGRNKLFEFLRQKKILMSNNLPFQKYVDAGWFKVITNTYNDIPITQTVVFLKGIEKICELLDKFGYKKKER